MAEGYFTADSRSSQFSCAHGANSRGRHPSRRSFPPLSQEDWRLACRQLIRHRMRKRNLTYQELADLLAQAGVPYPPRGPALKNRINRCRFPAYLLFQILWVLEVEAVTLAELVGPRRPFDG